MLLGGTISTVSATSIFLSPREYCCLLIVSRDFKWNRGSTRYYASVQSQRTNNSHRCITRTIQSGVAGAVNDRPTSNKTIWDTIFMVDLLG